MLQTDAVTGAGAPTPIPSEGPRIMLAHAGQIITLQRSRDGRDLFIQIQNDQENTVIAFPVGATPWLGWAIGRALA